jgi:hypothetical protein
MIRRWVGILGLLLGLPAVGAAQSLEDYDYENLSFRGIGFDAGYIWPNKVQPAPIFTLRADLGYLGPGVRVLPSLSYWSSSLKERELWRLAKQIQELPVIRDADLHISAADLGAIHWSDLSLNLEGHFVWETPVQGVLPYVGAGLGLHLMNGSGDLIQDTFVEDLLDTVTAGISVLAGTEFELGPRFTLHGEVRYTMVSNVRFPGVRIGASYLLPVRGGGE